MLRRGLLQGLHLRKVRVDIGVLPLGLQEGWQQDLAQLVLLTALLSLAACVLMLASGAKSSERFTTHIGSRLPPAELGCAQSGHVRTDEGRRLKVFKCPI